MDIKIILESTTRSEINFRIILIVHCRARLRYLPLRELPGASQLPQQSRQPCVSQVLLLFFPITHTLSPSIHPISILPFNCVGLRELVSPTAAPSLTSLTLLSHIHFSPSYSTHTHTFSLSPIDPRPPPPRFCILMNRSPLPFFPITSVP